MEKVIIRIETLLMLQEKLRVHNPETTPSVSFLVEKKGNEEKYVTFRSNMNGEWELITPVSIVTRKLYKI